jgi:peptidoglycan/xylan/chitin deacetylase (PgdA/CDA1 family)
LTLRILARGFTDHEAKVLQYLLFPFRAELTWDSENVFDLIITKGAECRDEDNAQIVVPPSVINRAEDDRYCSKSSENGITTLPCDILDACIRQFQSVLNPKISLKYTLSTKLPFSYNIFPSSIRSRLLKLNRQGGEVNHDLSNHLLVENARKLLTQSFDMVGLPLERKAPASIYITHDVETERGLRSTASMKRIEEDLGLSSTWFIVSNEYRIKNEIIKDLADGSEIGSHDIRHDGRLIHVREFRTLVERLRTSRIHLEEKIGKPVKRFRSPLLQFSNLIINALEAAGYEEDFSLPCWEPVHPATMSSFGIEATQPIGFGNIVEHPLTLCQDHQLLNVLGLNTREANKLLIEQARIVNSFGGDIVLLVHPDYAYSQNLDDYRDLLTSLRQFQNIREMPCSPVASKAS